MACRESPVHEQDQEEQYYAYKQMHDQRQILNQDFAFHDGSAIKPDEIDDKEKND